MNLKNSKIKTFSLVMFQVKFKQKKSISLEMDFQNSAL